MTTELKERINTMKKRKTTTRNHETLAIFRRQYTVNMNEGMMEKMEQYWKEKGFSSRSKFIAFAVQQYVKILDTYFPKIATKKYRVFTCNLDEEYTDRAMELFPINFSNCEFFRFAILFAMMTELKPLELLPFRITRAGYLWTASRDANGQFVWHCTNKGRK